MNYMKKPTDVLYMFNLLKVLDRIRQCAVTIRRPVGDITLHCTSHIDLTYSRFSAWRVNNVTAYCDLRRQKAVPFGCAQQFWMATVMPAS